MKPREYAHMCQDEHERIGFNDSEHERCPVCRVRDELDAVWAAIRALRDRLEQMALAWNYSAPGDQRAAHIFRQVAADVARLLGDPAQE